MTYQRALEIINQADEVPIWGYALDDTGWYLFILDRNDEDFPEPLAWDIMLDEYRDAPDARKRAKRKETWWVSTVDPQETIRQNHWGEDKRCITCGEYGHTSFYCRKHHTEKPNPEDTTCNEWSPRISHKDAGYQGALPPKPEDLP